MSGCSQPAGVAEVEGVEGRCGDAAEAGGEGVVDADGAEEGRLVGDDARGMGDAFEHGEFLRKAGGEKAETASEYSRALII